MVSWVGLFFLGSAVVNGKRVSGGVRVFCAPRMCGRNQVDQNGAYGVSKRVLNSIHFHWGYSELYLRVVLENPGTGCLLYLRGPDVACITFVCSTWIER